MFAFVKLRFPRAFPAFAIFSYLLYSMSAPVTGADCLRTRPAARLDYRKTEAAMSLYEMAMVAIAIIKIVIDIILRLRRRRKEDDE